MSYEDAPEADPAPIDAARTRGYSDGFRGKVPRLGWFGDVKVFEDEYMNAAYYEGLIKGLERRLAIKKATEALRDA